MTGSTFRRYSVAPVAPVLRGRFGVPSHPPSSASAGLWPASVREDYLGSGRFNRLIGGHIVAGGTDSLNEFAAEVSHVVR
jgi:hypothetical protein